MGHPDGRFYIDGADFDNEVLRQFERNRPLSIQGTHEQVLDVMSDLMKAGAQFVGAIIEYADEDLVEPTDDEVFPDENLPDPWSIGARAEIEKRVQEGYEG